MMTRAEMSSTVAAELEHIPDWPGEQQGELRMRYNAVRRGSLGKNAIPKKSASDVLHDCIDSMKKANPPVQVNYDNEFFDGRAN
jgi:hypothetical protein